ncbi:MAG: hypothetical protein KatS3mg118_0087 [Paracoccaceae bacterium]|nr:MAG: hypothetical protein KatS3mg118_0087 [Paracoccaceae bacterium]
MELFTLAALAAFRTMPIDAGGPGTHAARHGDPRPGPAIVLPAAAAPGLAGAAGAVPPPPAPPERPDR